MPIIRKAQRRKTGGAQLSKLYWLKSALLCSSCVLSFGMRERQHSLRLKTLLHSAA